MRSVIHRGSVCHSLCPDWLDHRTSTGANSTKLFRPEYECHHFHRLDTRVSRQRCAAWYSLRGVEGFRKLGFIPGSSRTRSLTTSIGELQWYHLGSVGGRYCE